MINFKYQFQASFIKTYRDDFIISHCIKQADIIFAKLKKVDRYEANKYSKLFQSSFFLGVAFCHPRKLNKKIEEIYNSFPIIADRYHPSWIFKSFKIDFSVLTLALDTKKNKDLLVQHKVYLKIKLNAIIAQKNSKLAQYFIDELDKSDLPSKIRNLSIRLRNVCNGDSVTLDVTKKYYPTWVLDYESIFNYNKFRDSFGTELITSSRLTVCPYCNKKDIEPTVGKRTNANPDIDHFYPKSRYPFLAVSLYNLIPSCNYCNQKFKRNRDTYPSVLHPLVGGMRKKTLFNFFPKIDDIPDINLINHKCFTENISLFELEAEYTKLSIKEEYKAIEDILDSLQNLIGGNLQEVLHDKKHRGTFFKIGDGKTALNTPIYKFRLDALNKLTGCNFRG